MQNQKQNNRNTDKVKDSADLTKRLASNDYICSNIKYRKTSKGHSHTSKTKVSSSSFSINKLQSQKLITTETKDYKLLPKNLKNKYNTIRNSSLSGKEKIEKNMRTSYKDTNDKIRQNKKTESINLYGNNKKYSSYENISKKSIKTSYQSNSLPINDVYKKRNNNDTHLKGFITKYNHYFKISLIVFIVIIVGIIGIQAIHNKIEQDEIQKEQARLEKEQQEYLEKQEEERQQKLLDEQFNKDANKILELRKEQAILDLKSKNLPSRNLDVPLIYQYPEYQAGCEAIAMTNMLNYFGFNLKKNSFIETYLRRSSDFVYGFYGSYYDDGIGGTIMAPGITLSAKDFLKEKNSDFKAYNVSGRSFEDLFAYIEHGYPVEIWTSLNEGPLGSIIASSGKYNFYTNTHTVVLSGFDRKNNRVYLTDSINGKVYYDIDRVKSIFVKQNAQAVVIISNNDANAWANGEDVDYKGAKDLAIPNTSTIDSSSNNSDTEKDNNSTNDYENDNEHNDEDE